MWDTIRDVISEPFAVISTRKSKQRLWSGMDLKRSLPLYLLKILSRVYINTEMVLL